MYVVLYVKIFVGLHFAHSPCIKIFVISFCEDLVGLKLLWMTFVLKVTTPGGLWHHLNGLHCYWGDWRSLSLSLLMANRCLCVSYVTASAGVTVSLPPECPHLSHWRASAVLLNALPTDFEKVCVCLKAKRLKLNSDSVSMASSNCVDGSNASIQGNLFAKVCWLQKLQKLCPVKVSTYTVFMHLLD